MLQAIRDRATGWIAWVIVILICIPFALWGVNQYFDPDQGLVVAKVNDTEIGYYQYRSAYEQQRARLQQMLGGSIPPGLVQDARLREQALERLIEDEVLVQQAVGNGLRVGDTQLATAILGLPAFQQDGRFSQQVYEQFLRTRGTSPQSFELDLRRSMLGEQVLTALQRSAIVTRQELDAAFAVRNEERSARTLRVDPAAVEVPDPSPDSVRAWFDAHRDQYVQPQQVKIQYLEIDRDTVAAQVTADDAELRAIYEERARQGAYLTPEQREARHILVTVDRDAPPEEAQAAREKLVAMRERIAAGEDFADVAREGSQDPGSAPLGGSLGFFGKGVMDPAFEEAAFSQAEGALGEPVRSRFGWHLIEVTGIQPEKVRTFDDARADVLRDYQDTQASQIFAEQADRLATLGFEHPGSLEPAAEALGLEPRSSEFFSAAGDDAVGLATNPRVRSAAFSDEVLEANNNSDLLEVAPGRLVLLRVAERKPSREKEFDEVRDEIVALLRSDAAAAEASRVGKEILDALQAGEAMEEVAVRHGLTWDAQQTVKRDARGALAPAVLDTLFRLRAPTSSGDGEKVYGGTSLAGGAYVVVALEGVSRAPAPAEPAPADGDRQQLEARLETSYGRESFDAVMEQLRESTEVTVYQQNLRPDDS